MPCNILLKLSTKPYEYEAFTGGQKVKSMVEPSNREKILFHYLTGEDPELNWEKNQGKGGMLMTGEYSNDAAILAGEGNAKKHSRFVIEFDDDIKPFDMSGDSFSLDGISQGTVKSGKGSYKSNGQSEAQKIADRAKAIETLVKERKKLADDADSKALFDATYTCLHEPSFIVHSCLVLGLPIPSGLTHYDV
ncbi:MAG: hypothetical protein ACK5RE_17990 [Pseudanabaena sp.]